MKPLTAIPLLIIRFYKIFVSPFLPASCRFAPSCSAYAIEAINKYGMVRGGLLALKRISRCHPWGGSGYDPVETHGEHKFQNNNNNNRNINSYVKF